MSPMWYDVPIHSGTVLVGLQQSSIISPRISACEKTILGWGVHWKHFKYETLCVISKQFFLTQHNYTRPTYNTATLLTYNTVALLTYSTTSLHSTRATWCDAFGTEKKNKADYINKEINNLIQKVKRGWSKNKILKLWQLLDLMLWMVEAVEVKGRKGRRND